LQDLITDEDEDEEEDGEDDEDDTPRPKGSFSLFGDSKGTQRSKP